MPVSLPYLSSNKNVGTLFEKISSAKIPPKFNHEFLQTTLGLKSTNDRPLIPLLRNMGFIDQSGTPMAAYAALKGVKHRATIAQGVHTAYGPLFSADERANELTGDKLRGLVAQVSGTDEDMTARIASTFAALAKLGDFTAEAEPVDEKNKDKETNEEEEEAGEAGETKKMRTEFHYNIQIHLPANATEETYQNIFRALRKTFQ